MKKIFLLLLLATPSFAAPENIRFVSVRGEGEIKVKPDHALLQLQVHSKGKTAKAAQALNAKETARVMDVLKGEFKIDAKDIRTSSFRVNPEYDYQNGKQNFRGYVVDHDLAVTYRKIDKAGDLLDGLVGKGAEEVAVQLQGISFDTEKRKEVEIEALELAMKNALSRAEALARFAKRSLRGVLRISDSSVNVQPYRPMVSMMAKADMATSARESTAVSPGEINVTTSVAVDYELE